MKTYFFLLMILATVANPVIGQKQLPTSIQSYAVNWGYSVKSMLQAAGYEVPGPKATYDLKPRIENRSDALQLDSTITYHGYDLNLQDSMPLFRNIYTYPQPDTELVTEYFYNVDHWTPLSLTMLISDELGRLVEAYSQWYDEESGTYMPDSRIELYPHEDSMTEVDSFYVFGWSIVLNDWHRLIAVWNRFDGEGRLGESLSSTEIFEYPIVFLDRYAYNDDHEVTRIESFNIDGEEEYPGSRQFFWYTDHLLESSILEISDGLDGFVAESKITYTYTPSRQQELVKSYFMNMEMNDWELDHVTGYVYDDEKRVTMKEEVSADGFGGWNRMLSTHTYVTDEYLATTSTFSFDQAATDWLLTDKTYYFYNELTAYEPVDPVVMEDLIMWPNPASGNVMLGLEGEALVQIYGLSGQLMQQVGLHSAGGLLDVSSLPAGIYIVKAKRNDVHYAGKLIVQ